MNYDYMSYIALHIYDGYELLAICCNFLQLGANCISFLLI